MVLVLAALKASPALIPNPGSIRRAHRTAIPREKHPAVHLIDGNDVLGKGGGAKCGKRDAQFTVSIFVRSDEGATPADAIKLSVVDRINAATYPSLVQIYPPGQISIDTETADLDATRLNIDFEFTYPTAHQWSLALP